MTAEEKASQLIYHLDPFWKDYYPLAVKEFHAAIVRAIREAEAAAAARQREADAAVCRAKADEFRELLVDEAVQAASECAAEILAGGGGRP
jgi:hypothetical protein